MDFLETSTIHGVTKIYQAKETFKRIFWSFILLLFMGSFSYFMYSSLKRFAAFGVQVTTTYVDNRGPVSFPAVTICNVNRVSISRIKSFYKKYNVTFREEMYCDQSVNMTYTLKDEDIMELSDVDNFFIPDTCKFNGVKCSDSLKEFHIKKSVFHGTCFVFNFDGNQSQSKPGHQSGLEFVLNIEEDEYFPCDYHLNHRPVGAMVVLHEPDEPPFFENAIIASPNQLTRIGLTKTYAKRLPLPYIDDCRQTNDASRDEYPIITDTPYTVEYCFSTCYIYQMNETCNVVDFESAYIAAKKNITFNKAGNHFNPCIENYIKDYNDGLHPCICRPLCEETHYHYSINTGKWPPQLNLVHWKQRISKLKKKTVDTEFVKNNLVAMQIYYNEFKTLRTIHTPDYAIEDFASDLGGFSGLWIGASIFSLVELFAFIFAFIPHKLKERKKKKAKMAQQNYYN